MYNNKINQNLQIEHPQERLFTKEKDSCSRQSEKILTSRSHVDRNDSKMNFPLPSFRTGKEKRKTKKETKEKQDDKKGDQTQGTSLSYFFWWVDV